MQHNEYTNTPEVRDDELLVGYLDSVIESWLVRSTISFEDVEYLLRSINFADKNIPVAKVSKLAYLYALGAHEQGRIMDTGILDRLVRVGILSDLQLAGKIFLVPTNLEAISDKEAIDHFFEQMCKKLDAIPTTLSDFERTLVTESLLDTTTTLVRSVSDRQLMHLIDLRTAERIFYRLMNLSEQLDGSIDDEITTSCRMKIIYLEGALFPMKEFDLVGINSEIERLRQNPNIGRKNIEDSRDLVAFIATCKLNNEDQEANPLLRRIIESLLNDIQRNIGQLDEQGTKKLLERVYRLTTITSRINDDNCEYYREILEFVRHLLNSHLDIRTLLSSSNGSVLRHYCADEYAAISMSSPFTEVSLHLELINKILSMRNEEAVDLMKFERIFNSIKRILLELDESVELGRLVRILHDVRHELFVYGYHRIFDGEIGDTINTWKKECAEIIKLSSIQDIPNPFDLLKLSGVSD